MVANQIFSLDEALEQMNPFEEAVIRETRRQFFSRTARGLGVAALATMFGLDETGARARRQDSPACRIFRTSRRKQSALSTCTCWADRRSRICSTTSPA